MAAVLAYYITQSKCHSKAKGYLKKAGEGSGRRIGLAPAIKINFVTSTISGLKVFDLVLSTTNGGPAHQTETILTLMYSKFSDGNFGYASAFGIVFLLMTMVVSAVMLGIFKKWEEYLN